MSKVKVLYLMLAVVMVLSAVALTACQSNITPFERPTEDINAYLDTPEGDLTTANTSAIDNLFIAHKILLQGDGFYGHAHGFTTAVGVKQEVSNTRYVVGDFDNKNVFKQMITKGIVANAYQLFLLNDNYIYRASDKVKAIDNITWKDTAEPLSEESFYNDFGHRFDKLTGYILNYDTVVSGELYEQSGGLYTYHYVLDTDTSTIYLRREMITNGNLQSDPVFSKAEIYVTMDANWNIKSLRTDCAYKAHTMGINAPCTEDITEVIEPYDGQLPEYDFFEPYFGQEGGGINKETTALDVLLKIFEPYLNGEDLQIALTASTSEQQIVNALVSVSGLDISDLSKLSVSAKLGQLNVDYDNGDGAIYLKYQDFQGSTTVDGITDLISMLTAPTSDDGSLLDGIDVDQLLENLTYTISLDGKKCEVSLPVSIEGLNIDAKLYADIDGETYTFTRANIAIGDVTVTIAPEKWQVPLRTGAYPEILGLTDLISSGTLALQGQISLPLNGTSYDIDADAQLDLATMNGSMSINLGKNGVVDAVLYDNVAYLTFGEVKAKLDLSNLGDLISIVGNYLGDSIVSDVESLTITDLLGVLSSITATETQDGGVTLSLSIGEVQLALDLTKSNNRWQLGGIYANSDSFSATVLPSEYHGNFTIPTDADSYADITQLVETFAQPIVNLVRGNGFGATFNLDVTTSQTTYSVYVNILVDVKGTVSINVKAYEGAAGILSAEVYYVNGTVYLTLNGLNVAFDVANGGGESDISDTFNQLMQSEQLQSLLDGDSEIALIVKEISDLIDDLSNFNVAALLETDLSKIITYFEFDGNALIISVDGDAIGFEGRSLDLALYNDNGKFTVDLNNLTLATIVLDAKVTLFSQVPILALPNLNNYVLTLHGEVMGAEVDVTLDIANMDIWATVRINNDVAYLRYVNKTVYVKFGEVAISLDTTNLGTVIERVSALLGGSADGSILGDVDIEELLSHFNVDLASANPNVTFTQGDLVLALNFQRVNNQPYFDSITVNFKLNDQDYSAKLVKQGKQAEQLDVSGQFVDGNLLLDQIFDTIDAYSDIQAISAELHLDVIVNDKAYVADVTVNYNNGVHATLLFKDKLANIALVSAEIYYVDNTLYLDVNGIRQAIRLPENGGESEIDVAKLIETITQIEGVGAMLDQLASAIEQLPEVLKNATISDVISALYHDKQGKIVMGINLKQFDLGEFTVMVGLGNNLTLEVDSVTVGDVTVKVSASVLNDSEQIVAPNADTYITELKLAIGDVTALVKLDLYHMTVDGQLDLDDSNSVAFKYVDGNIYLTYGNVGAKLAIADLPIVLEQIGKLVEIPQLPDMGNDDLLATVMEWINKVTITRITSADGYSLQVAIDGVDVAISIDFVCDDTTASVSAINVSVDGETPIDIVAQVVSGQTYPAIDLDVNFVDVTELVTTFVDPIVELMNANGYSIGIDNLLITLGDTTYTLNATVELQLTEFGANVHADFALSVDNRLMLDGEIWLVDGILYVHAGDVKLAVALDDNAEQTDDEFSIEQLKQTLAEIKGYNKYLDQIIDKVLDLVDTDLTAINIQQLISSLTLTDGVLSVGLDGAQFGLGNVSLKLSDSNSGLQAVVDGLSFAEVAIDLSASVAPYVGELTVPNDDFTTNLVIAIDETNTLYGNIDLLNSAIRLQLISQTASGNTALDILYSFDTNIIKLTNGKELNVSVDVNSIANIVDEINKIVNAFAGADADTPLPGLDGLGELNLQDILASLQLSTDGGKVQLAISALGMNISATFGNGTLEKVVISVSEATDDSDGLTLTVQLASSKAHYAAFSDNDDDYVRIDEVFDDFYYGYEEEKGFGTIQNLIYTNSWKFDFNSNSSIDVTNEDGTTTKYEIVAGSYLAFYYNKTDAENIKLRAKLTVLKDGREFIILDLAYIDGRIYAIYDSNSSNSNDLRATVAVSALEECIELLPALIKVVPQIGDLIDQLSESLSGVEGSLTLGNLASIFQSVSYSDKTFSMTLNGGIIDGLGEVALSVTDNVGTLTLNSLNLEFSGVSVNLENITVSASDTNDNGEFTYVNDYILSYFSSNSKGVASGQSTDGEYTLTNDHGYDMSNYMNLDSIRELLVIFVVTADNVDDNGNRSFYVEGSVDANMIGLARVSIDLAIHVDIDKDNNVYLAAKIHRDNASGLFGGLAYKDNGGNSYLLLNTKDNTIQIIRDSLTSRSWCSQNNCLASQCTNTSILHRMYHLGNKDILDSSYNADGSPSYNAIMTLEEFSADTKTMVQYILQLINFNSIIESPILNAIGKENTNVYGIEDILKSYTYAYNNQANTGEFAILADLKPIDSALGEITANIVHVGNIDDVVFDEDGNFNGSGVSLTQIYGTAEMISIMNATYELNLATPTSGLATQYVQSGNYLW